MHWWHGTFLVLLLHGLRSVGGLGGSQVENRQTVHQVLDDGRILIKSNARLIPNPPSDEDILAAHSRKKRSVVTTFSTGAQEEIVEGHNSYRTYVETTSDMYYLTWNDALAEQAQIWADKCVVEHGFDQMDSVDKQFDSVGQNLLSVTGYLPDNDFFMSSWYGEKDYYNYQTNDCSGVCGHFTQMIWATTREIGCGKRKCDTLPDVYTKVTSYNAVYVVCNYGPAGNYEGVKPYKLGPPCTECALGSYQCYDDALCRDCVHEGISECTCDVDCGCGVKDSTNCTCHSCQDGWIGGRCCAPCKNYHDQCGVGWPAFACSLQSYIPEYCPLLCGVCKQPDPAVCSLTQQQQCNYYSISERGGKESSGEATTMQVPEFTTDFNEPKTTSENKDSTATTTPTATREAPRATTSASSPDPINCDGYDCSSTGKAYLGTEGCICVCQEGFQGERCRVQQEQANSGVIFQLIASLSEWNNIWSNLRPILVNAINDACNMPTFYRDCCPDAGARTSSYEIYLDESTINVGTSYPRLGKEPGAIEVMIIAKPLPNNELCVPPARAKRELRDAMIPVLQRVRRAESFTYLPQDVLFEACTSASSNITQALSACCNVTVSSLDKSTVIFTNPPNSAASIIHISTSQAFTLLVSFLANLSFTYLPETIRNILK